MATGIPFGWQVENASGVPVSGALITFKKAGTSTDQSAYTDKALTVPASNPKEADAAGWFNVYLDPALDYDITIKSADGSITYQTSTHEGLSDSSQPVDATLSALAALGLESGKVILGTGVDTASNVVPGALPVTATGSTTARTLADRFSEYTNVKDHGATGDGTTDDTTAIQAAITAANATTHKRLYFPAGTYKYTSQLIWNDGATWFGDGKDVSVVKLDSTAGNIIGIRTNTTSNIAAAQSVTSITSASTTATVTTAAAHGYTTGDLINIVGATQVEYIGSFEITVTSTTTFTYVFRGSSTSPATGTITCTPTAYMQSSIRLYDLGFRGYNAVLTVTPGEAHNTMIRAFSIEDLHVERCKFWDHKAFPISFGGVKNLRLLNSEFTTFGRDADNWDDGTLPDLDGAGAWWMASNPIDNSPIEDVVVSGNWVHDGDAAAYLNGKNVRVVNNRFKNIREGLYNRRLDTGGPSFETERFFFGHNVIEGVTSVWVQASGIELGAKSAIIAFNTFKDVEGPGVDITDTCEDVLVFGNQFIDCANHVGTTPDGTSTVNEAGSIWVRSTSFTTNVPSGIKILGNTIRSSAGNYGIRLYDTASGVFNNITIRDNDLVGSAADPNDILVYDTSDLGTNISIRDNPGASDYVPATTSWTPTVTSSTGTITTVTTPTARYWREGAVVHFTLAITVTDNGTGSGFLRFTLPTTPARSGACYGVNTTNGVADIGSWATSNTLVTVNTATGTYPVASGQTLRLSGFYLET